MLLRTSLVCATLTCVSGPVWAQPARSAFRVSVEPGVASLAEPGEQRFWGTLGGISAGARIGELAWVTAAYDYKYFGDAEPELGINLFAMSLMYQFDVLWITPVVELGLAHVRIDLTDDSELTGSRKPLPLEPFTGIGLEAQLTRSLSAGIAVRYLPLFGTTLDEPGYSVVNARFSLHLGH